MPDSPPPGAPVTYRDGQPSLIPVLDDEPVVLIYGRESSDPDDTRISVDHQIEDGVEYATKRWPDHPVLAYRDDDISGSKKHVVRPGWEAMLREVRSRPKGSVKAVWANEQARLTRLGVTSWDDVRVILNMAGLTEVHTSIQGLIGIEPGNSLAGRLYAVIDNEFAERTRVKVLHTHDKLAQEGRPSGRPPYGLKLVKDENKRSAYVHDPEQAPWVEKIFEWALSGLALSTIAQRLTDAGVEPAAKTWEFKKQPGRTVTVWGPAAVKSVLTSAAVAGLRAHTDADGVRHLRPAKWEPIIPEDIWRKVQRKLGQPMTVVGANGESYRVRTKPSQTPRRYLLSGGQRRAPKGHQGEGEVYGVLRCGKCGLPLIAQTQARRNGDRVPAYACHSKLKSEGACGGVSISPADDVERHVVAALQDALARSPELRARLEANTHADAARWRRQRDEARARMVDASQLYGAGTIERDAFDAMLGAARTAYDAAVGALGALATDLTLPSIEDVTDRWDQLSLAQQRAVVEALIERIDVAPNTRSGEGFSDERLGAPIWRA